VLCDPFFWSSGSRAFRFRTRECGVFCRSEKYAFDSRDSEGQYQFLRCLPWRRGFRRREGSLRNNRRDRLQRRSRYKSAEGCLEQRPSSGRRRPGALPGRSSHVRSLLPSGEAQAFQSEDLHSLEERIFLHSSTRARASSTAIVSR